VDRPVSTDLLRNPAFWAVVSFLIEAALQVSGWQNSYVAAVLWIIVFVLLLYALARWIQLPASAMFTLRGLGVLSFGRMMLLAEANRVVYDALRGTAIRKFIDRNFDETDQRLRVVANYVAGTSVPLFGREPAGAALVPFDKGLLKTGQFRADGSEFKQYHSEIPNYSDVSLKRGDLRRVVRELRSLSAHMPDQAQ